MRARLTAIVIMMMAGQAVAAGLTPQQVRQFNNYWQPMNSCNKEGNSKKAAECFEAKALIKHNTIAQRKDETLVLKMADGEQTYTNDTSDNVEKMHAIILLGYLEPIDSFVLFKQYWEGGEQWLLDRKTGKTTPLLNMIIWSDKRKDSPSFSPSGKYMMDQVYNEFDQKLRIYRYDGANLTLVQESNMPPCPKDQSQRIDNNVSASWQSDQRIKIIRKDDNKLKPSIYHCELETGN